MFFSNYLRRLSKTLFTLFVRMALFSGLVLAEVDLLSELFRDDARPTRLRNGHHVARVANN